MREGMKCEKCGMIYSYEIGWLKYCGFCPQCDIPLRQNYEAKA